MFTLVYFAARYFAARFFPEIGATVLVPPGPGAFPGGRVLTVGADFRSYAVPADARRLIVPL